MVKDSDIKTIQITVTGSNYKKLKRIKERRGMTWRELLLSLIGDDHE